VISHGVAEYSIRVTGVLRFDTATTSTVNLSSCGSSKGTSDGMKWWNDAMVSLLLHVITIR
jgi:hypothetical protein